MFREVSLKRVLIVGVQQYISFHLCSRFLEDGSFVDGVLFQPNHFQYQLWVEEQMMWLGRNAQLKIFQMKDIFEENHVFDYDVIYYCQLDPHDPQWPKEWRKEKETLQKLLPIVKEKQCPFVFLSSIEIFGEDQEEIVAETKPMPSSEKGKFFLQMEKWLKEQLVQDSYLFVRIPTVYGPWQPPGQWMTDMVLKELKDQQFPRSNDRLKTPIRDLLYIEDVVDALLALGKMERWEHPIIHMISDYEKDDIEKQLSKRNNIPYKPIYFNLENVIVPQNQKTLEEGLDEQRHFLTRFNALLQNINK